MGAFIPMNMIIGNVHFVVLDFPVLVFRNVS